MPIVFYPLPEFAVSKFFSVDVAQAGIGMCCSRRVSDFDREGGQSDKFGNKDRAKSCQFSVYKHTHISFEVGRSDGVIDYQWICAFR